MNKFTLGAITGLGAVAIAIPVLATVTSAQSVGSGSSSAGTNIKPVPTVQCVQAISALEAQQITLMDSEEAARKSALQAHVDALNAAALITDDTQRQAAIQKANQDLKTAMQTAMQQNQTTLQSYQQAVKTACGNSMRGAVGGGFAGFMDKPMMGKGSHMNNQNMLSNLAQKLGITVSQLQTEMQSGKTIQQIAQEHGVTLPTPPAGGMGRHMGRWHGNGQNQNPNQTQSSSSIAATTQS